MFMAVPRVHNSAPSTRWACTHQQRYDPMDTAETSPSKEAPRTHMRRLELVSEVTDEAEHLRDEGEVGVGRREGRHDLTRVRRDAEGVEAGHDEALGGGDQAEEADHREAAVVHLGEERLLLALRRQLLREAEGVPH